MSSDPDDPFTSLSQQGVAKLWAEQRARRTAARGPKLPAEPKRAHSERDNQQAVVKWLRVSGCMVNAAENERRADSSDPNAQARFQSMRKANGITKGWPDIAVALQDGRTVYIEMKSSVGRLSQAQLDVHAWLEAHHHVVVVGTSIDTVREALLAKGVIIGRARMRMSVPVPPLLGDR